MKLIHALVPALLLSVAATGVSAKVLLGVTRAGNFTYTASATPVPLNSAGATIISFNASKAGTYVLTYSAECSADNGAATNSGWIDLDVKINGVTLAPTIGTSDAFCSPDNVAGTSGWVRPSISMPVSLIAGVNTVQILGNVFAPVTTGWLGDSALVVHD